jgi:hypothetical protein
VSKDGGRQLYSALGGGLLTSDLFSCIGNTREYSTRRISARGVCVRQRRIDTTRNGNKRWEMSGGDDTFLDVSTSYFFFQKKIYSTRIESTTCANQPKLSQQKLWRTFSIERGVVCHREQIGVGSKKKKEKKTDGRLAESS